jgi:hypothetical protein
MVLVKEKPRSENKDNHDDKFCHIVDSSGTKGLCGEPEKCIKHWNSSLARCRCGRPVCPNCLYLAEVRSL